MKKFLPIAFAVVMTASNSTAIAEPWTYSEIVNPENLQSVKVEVTDGATEGCWTNIGEVQTYAEDKLGNLGYEVREKDAPAHFVFDVFINSGRSGGTCFGYIEVTLKAPAELKWSEGTALAILGDHGGVFKGYDNANYMMLDYVKELIDEMRDNAESRVESREHPTNETGVES
ncbi:hypothetical protein [Ruegeria sp. HKCCA5491]|uniref:hypothetical protein n=1 Tax=Ruegeria sp. HKCCA5491 TaxID=2682986 RepID=UPI00148A0B47|nr:hypothetical protein [Ruegeria sp. HKCCA5491]